MTRRQVTPHKARSLIAGLACDALQWQRSAWGAAEAATTPDEIARARHEAVNAGDMAIAVRYAFSSVRKKDCGPQAATHAFELAKQCLASLCTNTRAAWAAAGYELVDGAPGMHPDRDECVKAGKLPSPWQI